MMSLSKISSGINSDGSRMPLLSSAITSPFSTARDVHACDSCPRRCSLRGAALERVVESVLHHDELAALHAELEPIERDELVDTESLRDIVDGLADAAL